MEWAVTKGRFICIDHEDNCIEWSFMWSVLKKKDAWYIQDMKWVKDTSYTMNMDEIAVNYDSYALVMKLIAIIDTPYVLARKWAEVKSASYTLIMKWVSIKSILSTVWIFFPRERKQHFWLQDEGTWWKKNLDFFTIHYFHHPRQLSPWTTY